jgi:hypothetical protein
MQAEYWNKENNIQDDVCFEPYNLKVVVSLRTASFKCNHNEVCSMLVVSNRLDVTKYGKLHVEAQ